MIRLAIWTYTAGLVTGLGLVIGGALYCGPEAIVVTGLRLEAAQADYAFSARPVDVLDESDVPALLAEAPKAKRRK